MNIKKTQGFTLVEMLVVIAIIAILAAALFPAINSAIQSARATAVKQKGRGIWVAITTANTDREILDLPALWPLDLNPPDSTSGRDFQNAERYFTFLMSDGVGDNPRISQDANRRIVSDMKPESISAPGVTAASSAATEIGKDNNAWHVFKIQDSDQAEMPFLITRNVPSTKVTLAQNDADLEPGALESAPYLDLDSGSRPFGGALAVWVTRGGSTLDAKPLYLKSGRVAPVLKGDRDDLEAIRSQGGNQG